MTATDKDFPYPRKENPKMERIPHKRPTGISRSALRMWGLLFLIVGIIGRSVIQFRMLGLGVITGPELLTLLENDPSMMMAATAALVMQVMETCALPVFTFLLVEGFLHTSDLPKYFIRVLAVAVASEIPYDLAVSGKILDLSVQNPAFGLPLSLLLLIFFRACSGKSAKNVLIKLMVTLGAVGWAAMLRVEYGVCMVLVAAVLYIFWEKSLLRNIAGATVTIVCSLSSLFMMAAPMGFLAVHFYNEEKNTEENRWVTYLAYPVSLLIIAIAGNYIV